MTTDTMPEPIPIVRCQCEGHPLASNGCICPASERALRAGAALTDEQREWCLGEVASVEGYARSDGEDLNDADLGRLVLAAWADFARDKGLL